MPALLYLLNHTEPEVEYGEIPSKWNLSRKGREQAVALALSGVFSSVDVIVSSSEPRAFQTAYPIAIRNKVKVIRNPLFNELNQDGGFFMTSRGYEESVKMVLMDPDYKVYGWETHRAALARFQNGIRETLDEYNVGSILVVSHNIILTLFFCYVLGAFESAIERWQSLKYGAWGIINGDVVVKDIV